MCLLHQLCRFKRFLMCAFGKTFLQSNFSFFLPLHGYVHIVIVFGYERIHSYSF